MIYLFKLRDDRQQSPGNRGNRLRFEYPKSRSQIAHAQRLCWQTNKRDDYKKPIKALGVRSSIAQEGGKGGNWSQVSLYREVAKRLLWQTDRRTNGQRDERTSAWNVLYLKDMQTNEVKILEVLVLLKKRQHKKSMGKETLHLASAILHFFISLSLSLSSCLPLLTLILSDNSQSINLPDKWTCCIRFHLVLCKTSQAIHQELFHFAAFLISLLIDRARKFHAILKTQTINPTRRRRNLLASSEESDILHGKIVETFLLLTAHQTECQFQLNSTSGSKASGKKGTASNYAEKSIVFKVSWQQIYMEMTPNNA